MVKALVEAGADPALENAAGHDALFDAEENDKGDVVAFLLKVVGIGNKKEEEEEASTGEKDDEEEGMDEVEGRMEGVSIKEADAP